MRKEPGVYALVIQLERERSIAYDRKGTKVTFPAGWYVYVGSACGAGGLKGRTDRHLRLKADGKRAHWNVDYLREFASINEIWFSYTVSNDWEHHWASVVGDMCGATYPVPGFGANDCKAGCTAHLYHFATRPFVAGFRSALGGKHVTYPAVLVEFCDDMAVAGTPVSTSLLHRYDRGRRFLELRRRAAEQGDLDKLAWKSLARGQPARVLLEQLVSEFGVSFQQLGRDAKFAETVEVIVGNCGAKAFVALFDPRRPQRADAILKLCRTADTRQLYRVNGVLEGRFRSVAPQNSDTVYDTTAFAEVPSRLRRARGTMHLLEEQLNSDVDQKILAECGELVKVCRRAAKRLLRFVRASSVNDDDIPTSLRKEAILPALSSKSVRGRIVGHARLALRLTIKSLWDYPEMQQRRIHPTSDECKKTEQEIGLIVSSANLVLSQM